MAKEEQRPEASTEPGLSTERCPNCDGPLKFPPDISEAFCPTCSIFVEFVPSTLTVSPPPQPIETDNRKRLAFARFYVAMEDVLDEEPEPARPPEPPAEERPVSEGVPEPAKESEPSPVSEEVPTPAETPAETAPPEEPSNGEPRGETPPSPADAVLFPEGPSEEPGEVEEGGATADLAETAEPIEETTAEVVEGPASRDPDSTPTEAESQSGATALVFERPVVPLPVPPPPEDFRLQPVRKASEAQPAQSAARTARSEGRPAKAGARLGHRVAFYMGSIEVAIGGAGLVLGSLLHDLFRVPLVGHAFEAFGPINMAAMSIGIVLTLLGLTAIAFGTQAGKTRKARTTRG